jgi:hypothetical protein
MEIVSRLVAKCVHGVAFVVIAFISNGPQNSNVPHLGVNEHWRGVAAHEDATMARDTGYGTHIIVVRHQQPEGPENQRMDDSQFHSRFPLIFFGPLDNPQRTTTTSSNNTSDKGKDSDGKWQQLFIKTKQYIN